MIEMKDHPNYPREGNNTVPMYAAFWTNGVVKDGEIVRKQISSGWRPDQADTVALALRMNGHIVRGYFAGAAI